MMQQSQSSLAVNEFSAIVQNFTATIIRHKVLMIAVFIVMGILGTGFAYTLPDRYTAVSILLIQDDPIELLPTEEKEKAGRRDDLDLQTQRDLLLSPTLAKQVIQNYKMPLSLGQYMQHLEVTGGVRSRIIKVAFEDPSPELAAKVVNAHVDAYRNTEIAARKDQINSIRAKADAAIEKLKQVRAKRSQLAQNLRAENNLIKGRGAEELVYEQISEISQQIAPIQAKRFALQSRLDALKSSPDQESISDVVNSYLVQQLKIEENKRAQEYQQLKSSLGANNPDLLAAKKAWQTASNSVANEVRNIRSSLENELSELERQEIQLNERVKELGDTANVQQDKMIKLKELRLEEAASQKLLDNLLERYEQVQSQASFLQPKARIVTRAVAAERPSAPNRPLIVAGSLIFATILNTMIVLFLELRQSGVRNFAEIRALTDKEPLGILPKFAKNTTPKSALLVPSNKEASRKIVLKGVVPFKHGSVLITSAQQKEGRSTLTATLAYYLSMAGNKTLVIAIDPLGSDTIFTKEESGRGGLHDLLRGNGVLTDYTIGVDENLNYLPAGKADFLSSERLLSDDFSALLDKIQSQFDYVLIDGAPVLAHGEVETIAKKVSAVILIAEWMETDPDNVRRAIDILNTAHANIIGMILNKVDIGRYKRINPGSDFLLPRA